MLVVALFVALAAVMTWPQALVLATHAEAHQDVYFNLWRLRWVAHALASSPLDLFNGNQFYPERGVLAYSDAMLVEGVIAAPLLWARLPPVLVHNLMLLGAIAGSGVGAFVLARHLWGSSAGAVLAGIVFAFAPYRFDHYMHMELQWIVWTPWAFWALQRTIDSRRLRDGLLTGLFMALQMMSSVYYGLFLWVVLSIVAAVQLVAAPRWTARAAVRLAAGAVAAAAACALYSLPYTAASEQVGLRNTADVETFSARPADYRAAMPESWLYASPASVPERRLFPGALPPLIALAGLLLAPVTGTAIAYLIGLLAAFELSLGMNGLLYPVLYDYVEPFRGLRAPARAAIFVLLFLGLLTARGAVLVTSTLRRRPRRILLTVLAAGILLEYASFPLRLERFANRPPPLYRFVASLPPGPIIELPLPRADALPGPEPFYLYMSTFHWKPLLNGYSGYYPPPYLSRLGRLSRFPDARTVAGLKAEGVRYIIVHADGWTAADYQRTVEALPRLGASMLGRFDDGRADAVVFELR